ncbi:hypothetical protein BH09ACT8_BH09ACT8_28480 [soil metagenome]
MTRVLAVSDSCDVMGREHSLLNVSPLLSSRGVEMMLAAPSGGSFEERWRELCVPFRHLKLGQRQGFRPNDGRGYNGVGELVRLPFRTLQAIARIARLARRSGADVIHSNSLITHLDCAVAGRLIGTPSVLELHDIVAPGIGRHFMGLAVWLSGSAIAISNAVRDQLPTWARAKAVVIPQSVDIDRFDNSAEAGEWRSRLAASPDVPLIAAVGRIDPEKGLDILIRAVGMLRATGIDVQLVLVGSPSKDSGSYLAGLTELGERLLGDAMRIVPHVSDVPGVLAAVDILACPSIEEPFGLILLEAQASRVAVVASDSGGPAEFISHEETGLLVAPEDADALADALGRLLKDPALREQVARGGQTRVRTSYTAAIRADRFASLYRGLAGC